MTTTTSDAGTIPDEVVELLDRLDVRYELIDGQLVVSPSASFGHERLSGIVRAQLLQQAPEDFEVLGPDFNVYYAWPMPWFVCPDALASPRAAFDDDGIRVAPALVLETVSPSSQRSDTTGTKRDLYAALGVPSYWLVHPREHRLQVLELRDRVYVETATVTGEEQLTVELPFPATVSLRRTPPA